jgi:hypothetical protein
VYFIYFLNLTFFSFTFYNKIDETSQFFPCKKPLPVPTGDLPGGLELLAQCEAVQHHSVPFILQ